MLNRRKQLLTLRADSILLLILILFSPSLSHQPSHHPTIQYPASSIQHPASSIPNYKIYIQEDGLYKLSSSDLSKVMDLSKVDLKKLNITFRGNPIPIYASEDYILFYGEKNRSKYSHKNVYWLSFDGQGQRVKSITQLIPPVKPSQSRQERFEENKTYDPLPEYYRREETYQERGVDHWFWEKISKGEEKSFAFSLKDIDPQKKARIKIVFQSRGSSKSIYLLRFSLNNKSLGEVIWTEKDRHTFETEIDTFTDSRSPRFNRGQPANGLLRGENNLKIKNLSSKKSSYLYLNWFEVSYYQQETKGSRRLQPANGPQSTVHSPQSKAKDKRQVPKTKNPEKLIIDNPSNLRLTSQQADYIIITLKKFKDSILPLANFRESKGLKVKLVDVEDIYDEFNFGMFSPLAIRDFLRYAYYRWQKPHPTYILLVGDATTDVDWASEEETIPTYTLPTITGGDTGSDNWFACMDDDDIPDIALGRFPVDKASELKIIIDKTISYEKNPPCGLWRKTLSFVTSDDPNFGDTGMTLAEAMLMKMLNMYVPYKYDVNVTWGGRLSNYTYIPSEFHKKVLERINDGCLILSYVGHGLINQWGLLHRDKRSYPVFTSQDADRVNTKGRYPVLIEVCCLTGFYDHPYIDCISEKLLKAKFGVVAAFASSRISDPYGNGILEKELIYSLFSDPYPTLGLALLKAKERIITVDDYWRRKLDSYASAGFKAEYPQFKEKIPLFLNLSKKAHVDMYNLLGDPALKIAYPQEVIRLQVKKKIKRGELINIQGEVAAGFSLRTQALSSIHPTIQHPVSSIKHPASRTIQSAIITIECERDKIIYPLLPVPNMSLRAEGEATSEAISSPICYKDKKLKEVLKSNYENANNKIILKRKVSLKEGKFSLSLRLPENIPPGRYFIKCYLCGKEKDAFGCLPFRVK